MNAAEMQATLAGKLASLNEEIAAWRAIVDPAPAGGRLHPDYPLFTRHQSQVLRLADYFDGVTGALQSEIAAAAAGNGGDFVAARTIGEKILQGHALWSYFRSKLLFRYPSHLRRYLVAADELAWACFKPVLAARQAVAGQAVSRVPPLIYLSHIKSPLVFPREWSLSAQATEVSAEVFAKLLRSAPFSVVRLPYYQTRHLPETLVLAHEMGHVADFDLGLTAALDAELEKIPATAVSEERKKYWRRCRVEAFADAFGAVTGRAAFCRTMASFLAAGKNEVVGERMNLTSLMYPYPTVYLRVLLTLEVLRRPDRSLPDEAARIEAEWRQTYGDQHVHQDFEADLPHVVAAFLDAGLAELGGKSIREVAGLSPASDADVAKITASMLNAGHQPPTRDPRILLAAAALAFYRDPGGYASSQIEAMILSRIEKDADNAPRSAESIAPGASERDRQAGRDLADLFGGPPAAPLSP